MANMLSRKINFSDQCPLKLLSEFCLSLIGLPLYIVDMTMRFSQNIFYSDQFRYEKHERAFLYPNGYEKHRLVFVSRLHLSIKNKYFTSILTPSFCECFLKRGFIKNKIYIWKIRFTKTAKGSCSHLKKVSLENSQVENLSTDPLY